MPTYEYKCDGCGHRFDQFQSITAAALKKCPSCGKAKLRRLIGTGSGVIFKGSGFYTTDYRSEAYKTAAKSDTAPAASKATGDSKPADKPAESKGTGDSKPQGGTGPSAETSKSPAAGTPAGGSVSTQSTAATKPAAAPKAKSSSAKSTRPR